MKLYFLTCKFPCFHIQLCEVSDNNKLWVLLAQLAQSCLLVCNLL